MTSISVDGSTGMWDCAEHMLISSGPEGRVSCFFDPRDGLDTKVGIFLLSAHF